MSVPSDLLYSSDHEWVRVTGNTARIGITDYAQDALGDVVFVQPPVAGTSVTTGQTMSEVESTKSVSDIYAPVSGVVATVNVALESSPELLNSDPYGAGWICEIEMASVDTTHLLDASAYSALIGN